jgi:putative PIN family toxin of toxin-antitoxin system
MKAFLDTNVVVSAIATRGLCADVFRSVLEFHELIVSEALLAEIERIPREKIGAPNDLVAETLWLLQQDTHLSSPGPQIQLSLKDKSDIAILSSAVNGGAEVFITGDKEILDLKTISSLEILSPRDFWEKMAGPESLRADANKQCR